MMNTKIVLFVFSLLLLGGCGPSKNDNEPAESVTAATTLENVTGEQLSKIIDSYRGKKVVLLNMWATWCLPCVEEFPDIVKLQRQYEDHLQVVFVSADFADDRERAKNFLAEQGVDWKTYFKDQKDQPFIEAVSSEWSGALPFTKIIAKDGRTVAHWENKASFDTFKTNINQALTP